MAEPRVFLKENRGRIEENYLEQAKNLPRVFAPVDEKLQKCTEEVALACKYLYAFMPYSDIGNYPFEVFLDYAENGVKLWKENPQVADLPEEIFLNYVLFHRVNEEEIALIRTMRPGMIQLEIGVQSTNPDTIREIHRKMDFAQVSEVVTRVQEGHNVHQPLDLIAGLPFEDYESFSRSFDRVYAMQPEQLQLGFLKVLKGSDMHEHAKEYGIRYLEQPPYEVLYTNWISYGEIRRLKRIEEMVELYYNSGQFPHTLPVLEKAFPGPFAMYEALADYYQEQGYFTNSPARAYRYQILLEFAAMKDPANREIYRELLTYDMYLRENLKSRPAFAAEITEEEKQDIRRFYQTEEQERHYLSAYDQYDWKQLSRMTHLEPFRYPEPHYVLFDYQERNPLNYEAKVQVIGNPIL